MNNYLVSQNKSLCFGCEACAQVCAQKAITISEDTEGFRYPILNESLCIKCGKCKKVCPIENPPIKYSDEKLVFGGYHKDNYIKGRSTSGGAFTAIANTWCVSNYVIFGAKSDGLNVYHTYIENIKDIDLFRKSKYSQSIIGQSYKQAADFLQSGKRVLFSGTPCQIAGLRAFLGKTDTNNLLTVEVVCEGVPSPLYIRLFDSYCMKKYNAAIQTIDYRYKDQKDKTSFSGKWDFQVMHTILRNGKTLKKDRWFNPFWSIWLQHLMSRPSCYECPFTSTERVADITLGDLWGVHKYCPDLYGKNGGSSLIICNNAKGKEVFEKTKNIMFGHELNFSSALKYQGPLRKSIEKNPNRENFMQDLKYMDYLAINKKWAKKHSIQFIIKKYFFGNRTQVWFWNLTHKTR